MSLIIGVDEVGLGCIAGPVVTAGVVMPEELKIPGVKDSKKIGLEGERVRLSERIKEEALFWVIAVSSVKSIDEAGIRRCQMACLRACALLSLELFPKGIVIVDGNATIPGVDWKKQKAIVKADQKVHAVSSASIIAKVHRDRLMVDLWYEFPHYDWKKNAGYPTRDHKAALSKFGVSPYHRKSFAPVARILKRDSASAKRKS
jgi:ribonuclease HII